MDPYVILPTLGIMLVLLFLGVPVGITLAVAGFTGLVLLNGTLALIMAPQILYNSVNSFLLVAVPLFVTMGVILGEGGIGERLYRFFDAMLRHISGGLGMATILTCSLLAAMIGTSVAVAAMVGAFAIKNMLKYGASIPMSAGAVVGGGALGMLIPPSLPMIIYGAMTMESIRDLFIAGMVPGIIASVMFCAYIYIISTRRGSGLQASQAASWSERWEAFKGAYWGILIPVFILIALYTGLATPTELAAIGCALALIACVGFHRTLRLRDIPGLLGRGITAAAMVLIIITGAVLFGHFVAEAGISAAIGDFFIGSDIPVWGFFAISMLMILVMGCFMEGAAIMLITLPVLHPVTVSYGISPLVFAVMLVINIECAMITPPVGLNLYAVDGICKTQDIPSNLGIIIKGSWPYIVMYVIVMFLVAAFPNLATWLPQQLR